jgi:acyl-CoA thioester hydrolase
MTTDDLPLRIPLAASVDLVVAFHDADPLGVAWHGNYFRYFDTARTAMLEQIDYGYRQMLESGYVWPIVKAEVKFIRPLRFGTPIRVQAELLEWDFRLKLGYTVYDAEGVAATRGTTVQAAVDARTEELFIGAPEALKTRLRAWLARRAAA